MVMGDDDEHLIGINVQVLSADSLWFRCNGTELERDPELTSTVTEAAPYLFNEPVQ
jgi:hypothetical protein